MNIEKAKKDLHYILGAAPGADPKTVVKEDDYIKAETHTGDDKFLVTAHIFLKEEISFFSVYVYSREAWEDMGSLRFSDKDMARAMLAHLFKGLK